jgi:phage shock protein A
MRTTYDYVEDAAKDILGLAAQMSDRIEELEAEQGTARDLISDLETQIDALEDELARADAKDRP